MRTALVADDHADTRELIRFVLELEGWRVLEAEDGIQALAAASTHHPDVLVLDQMMPGLTGCDVLVRLRNDGHTTPAVLVTAARFPEPNPGFAAMLLKPFAAHGLHAAVEIAASGRRPIARA